MRTLINWASDWDKASEIRVFTTLEELVQFTEEVGGRIILRTKTFLRDFPSQEGFDATLTVYDDYVE